jgi:hypothetical protein
MAVRDYSDEFVRAFNACLKQAEELGVYEVTPFHRGVSK